MDALEIAQQLVAYDSHSAVSNVPVSEHLERLLSEFGFEIERIDYDDRQGVPKRSVLGKLGAGTGGFAYFGHSDVVPAVNWFSSEHGPFQPTVVGDRLYGRGSCDMKGSVACMLAAASRLRGESLREPLYFVCTADEEIGYGGADRVVAQSALFQEMLQHGTRGVIGEPTMLEVVHAHKGTFGFRATSRGRAAHSSTSEGLNANLAMIPFLAEMKQIHDECQVDPAWHHADFEPPTISWNIGINDHNSALNITAPQSICTVYYRPMPGQDPHILLQRARDKATECGLEFEVLNQAMPFRIDPDSDYVQQTLKLAGKSHSRTVCYGTDGGVFRVLPQLLVLGPGNIAQAHTHDEWISLEQLQQGADLYERLARHWCVETGR